MTIPADAGFLQFVDHPILVSHNKINPYISSEQNVNKSQNLLWEVAIPFVMIGLWIALFIVLFKPFLMMVNKVFPGPTPTQIPTPTQRLENAKLNNDFADLVARYKLGQISVIDLSIVTPFAWDRVYPFANFPDFMDDKDIDRILGTSWRNLESCDYALTTTSDSYHSNNYSLFIFTHEKRVMHCLIYVDNPRTRVYTNDADIEAGLPQENAFFIVDIKGIIRPIEK